MSEIRKLVEKIEKEIERKTKKFNQKFKEDEWANGLEEDAVEIERLKVKLEGVKEGIEAIKKDMKVKERRLINKAIKLAKYIYQDEEIEKLNIQREYKDLMDLTIEEDEYCLLIGQLFFIEKLNKILTIEK